MTTAERQIRFILDHILEWKMEPRPPGASVTAPKVCVLRVTPYARQKMNVVTRQLMLNVLNRCIAYEDAEQAAQVEREESSELMDATVAAQSLHVFDDAEMDEIPNIADALLGPRRVEK